MNTVGTGGLKANFSRYLKRVRSGARLVVTERGRAIASIQPVQTGSAWRLGWWRPVAPTGAEANRKGRHRPGDKAGERPVGCGHRRSALTLYLNSSSLVKPYVAELGSEEGPRSRRPRHDVATSVTAYAETSGGG